MENKYVEYYPIVNAIIQVAAIFTATTFGNYIGMYIVMAMLTFITSVVVLSSAYMLSTKGKKPDNTPSRTNPKAMLLIYVLYFASCYVIYTIGHPFLAGAYVTAVTILMLQKIMEMNND